MSPSTPTARAHRNGDRNPGSHSPFVELPREAWSELAQSTPLPLTEDEVVALRGVTDQMDLEEVQTIYLPLSRLLNLYVAGVQNLHAATSFFLGEKPQKTPYVIGIAGSVAAGKSTTARVLKHLLSRWPNTPRVELVTTDGFLYPNAELEARGILHRKGFPESYNQRQLLKFVADIKAGVPTVTAPRYSHLTYDIVPDQQIEVSSPDVLIVEGLNVLQPARVRSDGTPGMAVSDYFDFSLYVDANPDHVRQWYVDRFLKLRNTAFSQPDSYFHRYAQLNDQESTDTALKIWRDINEPNLLENVQPTRGRAKLVLSKGQDHRVTRIRLRKL